MALVLFFVGCGKTEQQLATGQVVAGPALPLPGFKGDTNYAVVQASALPALFDNFASVLSKQGLVKWDTRYDCNHFAALYVSLSQARFTVAAWHSTTPAQTLALAEFWYVPASAGGKGHAIVAAQTDQGLLFIEPQTGRTITLSDAERRSAYLVKW